jgi:hypothetical protein
VWDVKFIRIGSETYDLNVIEHQILRKEFGDARIHAAINCASISCPQLRNAAYVAEELDKQLDAAMSLFINDPTRNKVSSGSAELSAIFNWFSGDFKDNAGSVRDFVNQFAKTKLLENGKISYMDYNWSLNDTQ